MTEWGQPSLLATATLASMYFWALLSMWLWTVNSIGVPREQIRGSTRPD
jgi:hypothetical protein